MAAVGGVAFSVLPEVAKRSEPALVLTVELDW